MLLGEGFHNLFFSRNRKSTELPTNESSACNVHATIDCLKIIESFQFTSSTQNHASFLMFVIF